jgi:hypothetical protein
MHLTRKAHEQIGSRKTILQEQIQANKWNFFTTTRRNCFLNKTTKRPGNKTRNRHKSGATKREEKNQEEELERRPEMRIQSDAR